MGKPIIKRIFDYGEIIIGANISFFYVQRFWVGDLEPYLKTSGVVFAGIATICGLTLGFASVVEKADRRVVSLAGEKLLHATVLFVFASLFGVFALQVSEGNTFGETGQAVFKIIMMVFGFFFLIWSFYSAQYGFSWLLDVLYERFDVRHQSVVNALRERREAQKQLKDPKPNIEMVEIEKIEEKLTKEN